MKRTGAFALMGWAIFCAGCAADPYAGYDLGPARAVVSGCVDAMGGLKRWQSVKPIRAEAVVTVHDEAGIARVNKQEQVIDLGAGRIEASARLPDSVWAARVNDNGKARFEAEGFTIPEGVATLQIKALKTILHRVRGPLNLLGGSERAAGARRVRIDGMDLIRVAVQGSRADIAAYYFDAQTCLLTLATAGADEPGGEGTVTRYTYRMLDNGMAFPERISVHKIGRHVLIGDEPVLEVGYRNVRF